MANSGGTRWMVAAVVVALAGAVPLAACARGGAQSGSQSGARTSPSPAATTTKAAASTHGDSSKLPEVQMLERFDAAAVLGYRPEWVGYAVMPGGRSVRYMDVLGDVVAVHNSGNLISVLETSTGRLRWSLELGSPLERFVGTAQAGNGDLLCCQQGEIQVLDAKTGVLKDRQRLEVIANTAPIVFDTMVIFGCPTGEVLGHNLTSGYKQWGHKLRGAIVADLVRVGDNVAAVSSGGEVVILDPRRGSRIGGAKVFGGTDAAPAASERSVFIASLDQSVWSFDQFGGPARWRERTEFPLKQAPVYHDGGVYVAIPGQGLVSFDSEIGVRNWTAAGVSGEVVGIRGDNLIVWDGKVMSTVDRQRGDVVARVDLQGIRYVMTDAFVDGNLYTSTAKGEVSKFSPRK